MKSQIKDIKTQQTVNKQLNISETWEQAMGTQVLAEIMKIVDDYPVRMIMSSPPPITWQSFEKHMRKSR